ncbi:hypothetical protein D3D02_17375 [Halobellus sp. Atlit-38R]|nr:hypothetical protein D3D02_17375 [Halobellus sp. Atlit-38R]
MIARNVAEADESPDNLLEIDNETLINRLIGGDGLGEHERRRHRRVLEVFSLFDKVEWKLENEERSEEAEWLAEVAGFEDRQAEIEFNEIVEYQRDRGILKGEYYLSVTPLPLATHLLGSWLEKHGKSEIEELFEKMPPDMLSRFGERIPYMASYRPGRQWISEKLSTDGLFYENEGAVLETDWGSQLFLQFAEAAPRDAIDPAESFVNQKSVDKLRQFTTGRRNIIQSLQYMAVWDDTFKRAAELLLDLAEAENEEYANNATGIFTGLFSPGWGKLAPTETPPQERLSVLEEAMQSDSDKRQLIAVEAAGTGLKNPRSLTKIAGPEYQGARETPDLWVPETYEELFAYYRSVWDFLNQHLDEMRVEVRKEAVSTLLGSVRGLADLDPSLSQMIRKSLQDITEYEWTDRGEVIRTAVELVHYDFEDLEEIEEAAEWRQFVEHISESSFNDRLRRYVGLSLLADDDIYEQEIDALAADVIEQPGRLEPHLSWLATTEPNQYRVREFGYALGARDDANQLLTGIRDTTEEVQDEERSISLLSGYLSALHERDEEMRQEVLDQVEDSEILQPHIVDLIRLSGLTEQDARRIVELIQEGEIAPHSLRGLESGGVSRNFEETTFQELVELLLEAGTDEAAIILPTFYHYYVHPDDAPELPEELTFELLSHPAFTETTPDITVRQGVSYDWKEIAQAYIERYPDRTDEILETLLKVLGQREILIGGSPEVKELLYYILRRQPQETWTEITIILEERDERLIPLFQWFTGEDPHIEDTPIEYVPQDLLWEWVEEDPEVNAILAARLVPAELFHSNERVCLARELLAQYGDRDDVRDAFSGNYRTESWVGPESEHYTRKKERLEEFREEESNRNVLRWVNNQISELKDRIEQARRHEERLGFDIE